MALTPKARENDKMDQTFITPNSVFLSHSPTLPLKLKINPQNPSNKPYSNKKASYIAQLSKLITIAILTTPLKLVNLI